MDKNIESDLV